MVLELHAIAAFVSVEVVHVDMPLIYDNGKEVATIGEADLTATLYCQLLVRLNRVAEHLAHLDLVLKGKHKVQTTRVESKSEALFSE